jgi:glycosyltransferase involved in cell wall biosynthesis
MRRLRALYICYLSLDDPLVHTQVIAYLAGLADCGHRIHLLTFETRRLTRGERREVGARLAARGIRWHGLRYHKRPSLPATAFDAMAGALYATGLVIHHDLDALHARSHVPAAMALTAGRILWRRRPALIFDIRGLMAEEYVDAGRWRRGGVPYRVTKAVERAAVRRADGIVVLTKAVRRQLFGADRASGVYVIPCCADLDTLASADSAREHRRAELGVADATVMVYVGKFGGWYMAAEMADFFTVAKRSIPSLHFLILTQCERCEIELELAERGVRDDYTITSATPELLGDYLAAADFGISFILPAPSKVSSSPTKIGEYLGAGLPVVCTSGVGDLDTLITPDIGMLVSEHTEAAYRAAADQAVRLLARPDTRERCRAVARRELSLDDAGLPRYHALYAYVAASRTARGHAAVAASAMACTNVVERDGPS